MDEYTLVKQSYHLIRKDFGLEEEISFEDEKTDSDWLLSFLTKQVSYLLDHDFNRLLNALYRIDIPEHKVQELLNCSEPGQLAQDLAQAIIDREIQKIQTRQKYQ